MYSKQRMNYKIKQDYKTNDDTFTNSRGDKTNKELWGEGTLTGKGGDFAKEENKEESKLIRSNVKEKERKTLSFFSLSSYHFTHQ